MWGYECFVCARVWFVRGASFQHSYTGLKRSIIGIEDNNEASNNVERGKEIDSMRK